MGCLGGLVKFAFFLFLLLVLLVGGFWALNHKKPGISPLPSAVMAARGPNGQARVVFPDGFPEGLDDHSELTWGGQPVMHRLMENGREMIVTARQAVMGSLAGQKDHALTITSRDGVSVPIARVFNKKRYWIPAGLLLGIGLVVGIVSYCFISPGIIDKEFNAFNKRWSGTEGESRDDEREKLQGPDVAGADRRALAFSGMMVGFFLILATVLVIPEWLEAIRNAIGTSLPLNLALVVLSFGGVLGLVVMWRKSNRAKS